jgi:hypothetical protein
MIDLRGETTGKVQIWQRTRAYNFIDVNLGGPSGA